MLPLFDTFKKEKLEKEVDVLDITSLQTSILTKYYPELGTTKNWDMGVQTSTPIDKDDPSKGFITLDRTFQDLKFDPNAYDFDYIKGTNPKDPFYQPTEAEQSLHNETGEYISEVNHWLVVQCVKVDEWFSNNSEKLQNFMCWDKREHIFEQRIFFKHKLIHTTTWDRPTVAGEERSLNPSTGGPAIKVCTIGAGKTNPTYNENGIQITTGTSGTFEQGEGNCRKWNSLDIPFVRTFNAGKGLGAVIKFNSSSLDTKVYLKATADSEEKFEVDSKYLQTNGQWGTFEDPIQLNLQFIEVVVNNPGRDTLKQITVNFYGEEFYRIQIPFKWDEEPDYIMHDEESLANTDKYHPPRKYNSETDTWSAPLFDTNFRINREFTPITNFGSRITQSF